MQEVKLCVVGDSGVGKTSLLISYTTNAFPSEYIPTIFEQYTANVMIDGRPISLNLNDTNGSEEYDRLRPLQYPDIQIFIVCFAVNNRRSFQNITEKWAPELIHHRAGIPMILCGTKSDLRDDLSLDSTTFVNEDEANSLKTEIGASKYIEISALTQENLKQLFDDSIRLCTNDRLLLDVGGGGGNNDNIGQGGAGFEFKCPECDPMEILNQIFQLLAFIIAIGVYILIDIFALIIAFEQYNTKDECWNDLNSLWMHPKTWLMVAGLTSIIAVGLGMLLKVICGIDEENQDWPRLCVLMFFFIWAIIGYVISGQIYTFDSCHKQSVGKMCIAWSIVKNIEFCCGSLDIVVNMYKFHFMN